ncbi:hypothetical protein LPJGGPFB_04841 [Ensifer adhaerens]|nr:hypothetical protein [Ensifer adhaerens]
MWERNIGYFSGAARLGEFAAIMAHRPTETPGEIIAETGELIWQITLRLLQAEFIPETRFNGVQCAQRVFVEAIEELIRLCDIRADRRVANTFL